MISRTDSGTDFALRLATEEDVTALDALIEASVRGLQAGDYTRPRLKARSAPCWGWIRSLSAIELILWRKRSGPAMLSTKTQRWRSTIAGCGGWSKRKTLFGADRGPGREPELLDPATDAAKVRAIFVHPEFARQGLGSLILAHVEAAARAAGFRRYEMGSTLTGVPLYQLKGYVEVERIAVPLSNGEALPVVKMVKDAR